MTTIFSFFAFVAGYGLTTFLMQCVGGTKLCVIIQEEQSHEHQFTLQGEQGNNQSEIVPDPNLQDTQSQCWNVDIKSGGCFTYTIDDADHVDTVQITITDRLVASYDNSLGDSLSSNHFCVSPDLERPPIPFISKLQLFSSWFSPGKVQI